MKKVLLVVAGAVALILAMALSAHADGAIPWTGHGSDVLPCETGGHWVLAPAFGIDAATLSVNGTEYVMAQSGRGSWSADSVGALDGTETVFVSYVGAGDERDHLQLSHCAEGSPSPTPPPPTSPPPTTPPPTTPPPTTPPPTSTSTPPPSHSWTPTWTPSHPKPSGPPPLAMTGFSAGKAAIAAGLLLALGLGSLYLARRRAID